MVDVSFVASHTSAYLDVIVNIAMRRCNPCLSYSKKRKKKLSLKKVLTEF